jgi:signal transduction histidine kinase
MSEWYLGSLLVMTGACIGFGVHAANLALQTRSRQYCDLVALAILEGAYCLVAYRYMAETSSAKALPWGQLICVFTPYITYVFGALTMNVTERRPGWLVTAQRINLVLTTFFVIGVLSDVVFGTGLVVEPFVQTDLSSAHRHRLEFSGLGLAYLSWVSIAFACFATVLFRDPRARRELAPMTIGCVVYFVATILDFGILMRVRDGHFIQHLGFFALLFGCWRVLAARFEHLIVDQRAALARLEAQRQKLLIAAPLLHKQKLDSLGTLAAGVAHEINNPISGILNYAHLMKRTMPADRQERTFVDEIEREAQHVAAIVRNLLRFGRADETEQVATEVHEVIQNTLTLVRTVLDRESITIRVQIEADMPVIVCRLQQLQQVLMNLVMNARDALNRRASSRDDEKEIVIRARSLSSEGSGSIAFEVIDNGDGFDCATAQRVFDPFFTTKPHGEGVGLGLSISHGIIQAHGGTLSCESAPGRRTCFRAELPCTPPTSGERAA